MHQMSRDRVPDHTWNLFSSFFFICMAIVNWKWTVADMYTNTDYTEVLLIYGQDRRNAEEACRLYQQSSTNKRHPAHTMFPRSERCLRETGSLSSNEHLHCHLRRSRTPDFEEAVIQRFEDKHDISNRSVAHTLAVNHMLVWQVLHDEHLNPYDLQKVQAMGTNDRTNCTCTSLHTLYLLFWWVYLYQGRHFQLKKQPCSGSKKLNAKHIRSHLHRFAVNVWAGIIDDHLMGSYLLPLRLNGDIYRTFLQETLFICWKWCLWKSVVKCGSSMMPPPHTAQMSSVSIWMKILATEGLDVGAQ
jgi:hypothetical protein